MKKLKLIDNKGDYRIVHTIWSYFSRKNITGTWVCSHRENLEKLWAKDIIGSESGMVKM